MAIADDGSPADRFRKEAPVPAASHPSGDKRFKMLEAAMKRNQFQPSALIEVLHTAQELFGSLDNDLLLFVAHGLKVPPSRVYGVATFYHFFTFVPKGEHSCVVCLGTACYVKGADAVLASLEGKLGVTAGHTRSDGKATVLTARCLGACGLAPAAFFDNALAGNLTPETALDKVKGWVDGTR
jgi:bidirectional [NiFe] hydrogenase diaphorase subunit